MNDLSFETIDGTTQAGGSRSRAGRGHTVVKANREKGTKFAQFALALMAAKGNLPQAYEIAKVKLGEASEVSAVIKAAVAAGSTTNPNWAGPLHETYQAFAGDFVDFLRSRTITGAFGKNGVPSLRHVPPNLKIPAQVTGGSAHWIREGYPIPLTRFDFETIELGWAKLGSIAVITRELANWSHPSAELIVRDQLASALIETLDRDFIDPSKAAVPSVSPASILNGIAPIAATGSDIEAVRNGVEALFFAFLEADNPPEHGAFIMSSKLALRLSLMRNMLGAREFPELTFAGGRFMGLPVVTSTYVPDDHVILLNTSDIYYVDGSIDIDASDSVSLEMSDTPTNNSVTPTGASLVSMFQTSSIATKVVKYVNYQRRRPSAVAWLEGVSWGSNGS